jgi:hypothetical protein
MHEDFHALVSASRALIRAQLGNFIEGDGCSNLRCREGYRKCTCNVILREAVPWLRLLVADLSPRRAGFDPGSVHVGFVVNKVGLGQVFSPSISVFPCQFHYTGAPLQGKTKKSVIFITGLHNKPQGCGASVASGAGPFTKKKLRHLRISAS